MTNQTNLSLISNLIQIILLLLQHFFNNTAKPDGLEKQNAIKFQADYWYQFGQYRKTLAAYQAIHDNPQVSSLTVERDIDESIIRCHLKLGNLSIALDFLSSLVC